MQVLAMLTPTGDGIHLTISHTAEVAPEFWDQYGAGRCSADGRSVVHRDDPDGAQVRGSADHGDHLGELVRGQP